MKISKVMQKYVGAMGDQELHLEYEFKGFFLNILKTCMHVDNLTFNSFPNFFASLISGEHLLLVKLVLW